jgi:hypothetical protein
MKLLYALLRCSRFIREVAMSGLSSNKGIFLGLMLSGVGLMSVAMFLHPMSPEDFLGLVLSNPLQTIADAEGGLVALLFWGSALVFLIGLAGLVVRLMDALHRLRLIHLHRIPAH